MKLRIRDRILSAVMGLLIAAAGVGLLLETFDLFKIQTLLEAFSDKIQRAIVIGLGVLLVIIGLCGVALLFRKRKDKGVVVQHTEYGDMSISMKAMENMVKKCVDAHPELHVNQTKIYHSRGGICVDIKITLLNGVNIPLTVNALQKQIKQYITSCSGVDVEEVRVMVETEALKLTAPTAEPTFIPVEDEVEVKPVEKATECLCQHQEEPATYAEAAVQPAEEVMQMVEEAAEETVETVTVDEPEAAEEPVAVEADAVEEEQKTADEETDSVEAQI
ncbi:MAG: alkaline shock response membrane anchor protein AmaP [Clostridia bacterium]|nr:alkaline shock response membrane anchor protein AmaP [Clostridia bacterium]MBQ7868704.1 alkaline shock response membrane anchor protein AmaP [Clostridia bacterium]